ncbi:hypothetical protein LOAG_13986, partial [Loa loa]
QLESFAKLHWAPYEYILFAKPNHAEVLRSLAELKGSSANGLLFPFHLFSIRSWSFKFTDSIEDYTLLDELDIPKDQVKLVIVIASGPKSINEDAESKTLNVTEEIRKEVDSAPICVVAQSDNQHEA